MRDKLREMFSILGIYFNPRSNSKLQIKKLVKSLKANYELAADYWVKGNNSGLDEVAAKYDKKSDELQSQCDKALAVIGIQTYYPGLYPSFKLVKGDRTIERDYGSLLSMINEAFDVN